MAGKWKPKAGDVYWLIGFGMVYHSHWFNDDIANERYYFGNCFKTRKQAEAVLAKIRRGK